MSSSSGWLVIGYGNSLRRDDGAGLLLAAAMAEEMAAAGFVVRLVQTQQLVPELAEELAAPDTGGVIFVDTTPADTFSADASPGDSSPGDDVDDCVRVERVTRADPGRSSSHHVAPALLLEMAAQLYGRCPPGWLVTIPGWDFDHGEQLSAETRHCLDEAVGVWRRISGLNGHSGADVLP